jgi:hypothetical protein
MCTPEISRLFDGHRSIIGSNNAFCIEILGKKHEQVIPADVPPFIIERHNPISIAVMDTRTLCSCLFHHLTDMQYRFFQRGIGTGKIPGWVTVDAGSLYTSFGQERKGE